MSDFRKFCIVLFVTTGLLSAADNHGLFEVSEHALIVMPLSLAAAFVGLFGRRAA